MKRTFGSLSLLALTLAAGMTLSAASVQAQQTAAEPAKAAEKSKLLAVGSDAPALKVGSWVKGSPVASFEKGKIYVVEFWATWCGPCKKTIPHLTELAKLYKDKVTVVGVSVWESDENHLTAVKAFVDKMGDKMVYSVAVDDKHGDQGSMSKTWMKASEQDGIPVAFIVTGEGKIAWIGHPAEMDAPLKQIVEGKFDVNQAAKDAKAKGEKAAVEQAEQASMMKAFKPIQEAMDNGENAKAITGIDELAIKYPNFADRLLPLKFRLQIDSDEAGAYVTARKLADGPMKANAQGLNELAWTILDTKTLKTPDFALAYDIAKRAAEVSKMEDGMILDTYALATFKKGEVARAIELQTKAIELTKNSGDDEVVKEMEGRLAEFKKSVK